MGLIKALSGGFSGTLADQWKEYFQEDSLEKDVIIQKGSKVINGKRSSNKKGSENYITNGSVIAVNKGQGAILVRDGKVIEYMEEEGVFTYDSETEPTIFEDGFKKGLGNIMKEGIERFKFGGDIGKNITLYYFNTKELYGLKFGTPTPLSYDDPVYQSISIRFFGQVSLKLEEPIVFFENVCGNVEDKFLITDFWKDQLQMEFQSYLSEALGKLANDSIKYNQIPQQQTKLSRYMNDVLDEEWKEKRGLVIESVGLGSISLSEEDKEKVDKIDEMRLLSDSRLAAGRMTAATANAMEGMATNEGQGGGVLGIASLNMLNQGVGGQALKFQEMAGNNSGGTSSVESEEYTLCGNGHKNKKGVKFCGECGEKIENETPCSKCGASLPKGAKFCSECGEKVSSEKHCSECGALGKDGAKFCGECGAKF